MTPMKKKIPDRNLDTSCPAGIPCNYYTLSSDASLGCLWFFPAFFLETIERNDGKASGKSEEWNQNKAERGEGRERRKERLSVLRNIGDERFTSQKSVCYIARLTFLSSAHLFPNSPLRRSRDHFCIYQTILFSCTFLNF